MNKKKSERDPFESAVINSSRYIYTLSYRLTGSQDDARDLMQETYLKAFQKWNSVKNRDNPIPWLRRICLNAFIDGGRKAGARQKMKETVFPSDDHDIVSSLPSPEDELLVDEEIRRIKSQCYTILSTSLSLYQRIAFVLLDIFQLEIREVSRLMHKSEASAKSLLYRARNKMNAAIGPNCSILNSDNYCKCKSWVAFSHDIEKRREHLREIINHNNDRDPDAKESSLKLQALYAALPYLNPPAQYLDNIFLEL